MVNEIVVSVGMGLASTLAMPMIVEALGKKARYVCCVLPNEEPSQFALMHDIERVLGVKIEDIGIGKTPVQLFREQKFIGNSLHDICSRILKRERMKEFMLSEYPKGATIYVGIGAHETDRELSIRANWSKLGYKVEMPLIEMPWVTRGYLMDLCFNMFGYVPELYKRGFEHGNCHGACVKAGIKQWIKLLEEYPHVYREWEEAEDYVRRETGKDVSMLRKMEKGVRRPITLKEIRLTRAISIYPDDNKTGCSFCEAI